MGLGVGKDVYVIEILESFYVEIIIFPIIFGGQTPPGSWCLPAPNKTIPESTRFLHFAACPGLFQAKKYPSVS